MRKQHQKGRRPPKITKMSEENKVSYREKIATIDKDGKRAWVFPKMPHGQIHQYRAWFTALLLILFYGSPLVKINGEPMLLFNFLERKFILFGKIFWPQDSYILFLMMISFIIFIILFSVIFGRIWCGWACPQTVFLEMVYRKVEYLIEGNANAQRRLAAQNWNIEKIWKKGLKQLIFISISASISHTALAYLVGTQGVIEFYQTPFMEHYRAVIALIAFTGAIYFIYAWFREQVCVIMCPYGRLQGVFLDSKTIRIIYDFVRGEPRNKNAKEKTADQGDCINCKRCVQVCPTGIDIRDGSQLECINCTACIDECNTVMRKIGRPTGLIRYDSENGVSKGEKLKLNPRIIAYSLVLIAILSFLSSLLITRTDIETTILRTPGMLFQEAENGQISNLYNVKIQNKTHKDIPVDIKIVSHEGNILIAGGQQLEVKNAQAVEGVFFVYLNKKDAEAKEVEITLAVYADGELV